MYQYSLWMDPWGLKDLEANSANKVVLIYEECPESKDTPRVGR